MNNNTAANPFHLIPGSCCDVRFSGQIFTGQRFETLSLGPNKNLDRVVEITDCRFVNCRIAPGEFVFRAGVALRRVVFEDVTASDGLVISANAFLDRVVMKGRRNSGGLWIKPDEVTDPALALRYKEWLRVASEGVDCMLDISEFDAPEISVMGLPLSKVVINKERHVVIRRSWRKAVDWAGLGIGPTSFWRIRIGYIDGFDVDEGVFGLPSASHKNYATVMGELSALRRLGFV